MIRENNEMPSDSPDTIAKDRKFIESLSRGLEVLRTFTQGAALRSNQDIARATGLPKATISRLTYTLTKLGYLSHNKDLEKYQLDSGVLALGYAYANNLRVRHLGKPYMEEFSRRTHTTVGLTCRDRLAMIYVDSYRPPEVSSLRMESGVRLPLSTSAAGRAYLAATPPLERKHLMKELATKAGDDWPHQLEGLEKAFEEYAQYGFCLSLRDWNRNVNAAGVPLRLQDGSLMVITCGGPGFQVSENILRDSLAHQLEMLARDIENLGA